MIDPATAWLAVMRVGRFCFSSVSCRTIIRQMRIISYRAIRAFKQRHPQASTALDRWYETVAEADWSSLRDVRIFDNSVDYVSDNRYVFNITRNFRLVAMVFFGPKLVYIRFIGTHADYDRTDVTTV